MGYTGVTDIEVTSDGINFTINPNSFTVSATYYMDCNDKSNCCIYLTNNQGFYKKLNNAVVLNNCAKMLGELSETQNFISYGNDYNGFYHNVLKFNSNTVTYFNINRSYNISFNNQKINIHYFNYGPIYSIDTPKTILEIITAI